MGRISGPGPRERSASGLSETSIRLDSFYRILDGVEVGFSTMPFRMDSSVASMGGWVCGDMVPFRSTDACFSAVGGRAPGGQSVQIRYVGRSRFGTMPEEGV